MIAQILPDAYDSEGRKVFRPDWRGKSGFRPTFPAGRFVSQPLKHWCFNFDDIRDFLAGCAYVSDSDNFGRKDYWQPPDQFEQSKRGDCEDFALWCWRQLLHMNYPARLVVGTAGRYGDGHSWVTFERDGKTYLLEPLNCLFGLTTPRLSTLRYHPKFSMGWDGATVTYYKHEDRKFDVPLPTTVKLVAEWALLWLQVWLKLIAKIATTAGLLLFRRRRSC